jgi:flagellar hook assembly protein FlgD
MTTRGEISVVTGVSSEKLNLVGNEFELHNNYPNPFNPSTNINFVVPKLSKVTLNVYNTLGQKVKTLIDSKSLTGRQTAVWNGKNDFGNSVPSGVYYYRLETESSSLTKSMVLLK